MYTKYNKTLEGAVVIEKNETVLADKFVSNVQTYLDEMMQFKREKLLILENQVLPSVMMLKYEKYKELLDRDLDSTSTAIREEMSQEKDMLLSVKHKMSFFRDLSDDEILSLVSHATFIRPKKGETLFNQGELGKAVFFIVNGAVDILVHSEKTDENRLLSTLKDDAVFGEIAPMLGELRTATAMVSRENSFILSIRFIDSADENSAAAYIKMSKNFMKVLALKLVESNETVYNLL